MQCFFFSDKIPSQRVFCTIEWGKRQSNESSSFFSKTIVHSAHMFAVSPERLHMHRLIRWFVIFHHSVGAALLSIYFLFLSGSMRKQLYRIIYFIYSILPKVSIRCWPRLKTTETREFLFFAAQISREWIKKAADWKYRNSDINRRNHCWNLEMKETTGVIFWVDILARFIGQISNSISVST